jgi:hypothetical protein
MRPLVPVALAIAAASSACVLAQGQAQATSWRVGERGALVYTRTTERCSVDPAGVRLRLTWIAAGAEDGGSEWRFFSCPRDREQLGWEQPAFDDTGWLIGRGEFAPDDNVRANVRTHWQNDVLLLRARVDVGRKKPKALVFRISHDDGVRVYGNGKLLAESQEYGRDRYYVVAGDAVEGIAPGDNLFAVRCENTGGWQHLDVAIAVVTTLPPGAKTSDEVRQVLQDERAAADRVRADLFGAFRPPPLLLQGELDAAQQRPVVPPGDLREVAFWAACDLQRGVLGGNYEATVPRLLRLGDLQLRGKVGPVDASGWQELDIAVKTTPEPGPGAEGKRFVSLFVRPHVIYAFEGRLRIRRRLQLEGARAQVAECRCELDGHFLRGKDWKDHAGDLRQVETFTFVEERQNQDATFRVKVGAAIDRGTAFLKARLAHLDEPQLRAEGKGADRSYHSGRLALALLAMIKGGVPRNDAVLTAVMQELRTRKLIDTYSFGNALMAFEAFYAPPNEEQELKIGRIERARQRQPSPEDKALMQRWTTLMLDIIDTRVDPAYLLRFNYIRGERFDHSVNQYGLLGLYSAHLCGIEVPVTLWEGAANHLIAAQCAPGAPLQLDLLDFRTQARLESEPGSRRTSALLSVRPAGWNYGEPRDQGEDAPVMGSMTCAGITGLAIAQAALRDLDLKRFKLQSEATAARNAGFGWLAQNFTARCHPGSIERQQHWIFYYLYGLERAALLSNIALIQGRDWYFEGAMVLVGTQGSDGSWPSELMTDLGDESIERTAMAVLFLKKGTVPVLSGQ